MPESMAPPDRMCAVCRSALMVYRPDRDGPLLIYCHGDAALNDHEVQPVPIDATVVGHCDFCTALYPTWVHLSTPFEGTLYGGTAYIDNGTWKACDPCHDLIDADRWDALTARAAALIAADTGHPLEYCRAGAAHLQNQFRHHYTGESWKDRP